MRSSDAPAQSAHVADHISARLATHAVNQHFDGVARDFLTPTVDALFELRARHDRARPLQQRVHQMKLARRQIYRRTLVHKLTRSQIELCLRRTDSRLRMTVSASNDRPHAREQLAKIERLDEIVIGAEVETRHTIIETIARSQHEHRRAVAVLPRAPQDFQSRPTRQTKIE